MLMAYKKNQKGQDLVEYALMLAIIIGIGWGIYSQTGVADSIKNVFGNASSLMETAKKNTGTFDMKPVIDRIKEIQTRYLGGGYGMDYRRGLIQSGWLTDVDKQDPTIGKLASELGATMWTYYNGLNTGSYKLGPDGGGLYWTTENLDSVTLKKDPNGNWSKETVLSYRYDPNAKDKKYSVIENRVWLGQPGDDGKTHNGLAQLPVEFHKPEGKTLGTFSTYEEAQKKYNEVKTAQKGYIYMGTAQTK